MAPSGTRTNSTFTGSTAASAATTTNPPGGTSTAGSGSTELASPMDHPAVLTTTSAVFTSSTHS